MTYLRLAHSTEVHLYEGPNTEDTLTQFVHKMLASAESEEEDASDATTTSSEDESAAAHDSASSQTHDSSEL
ncbi:MAG: hypothetical protein AAF402_14300 [Pseudomonadota bacterium]